MEYLLLQLHLRHARLHTISYDQDSDKAYISVSDINSKLDSLQESNLFALHLNIVSLVKNIDQVKSLVTKMNTRPDISPREHSSNEGKL